VSTRARTYFQLYEDQDGRWRWRLRSTATHDMIGRSTRGYRTEKECRDSIDSVKESADSRIRELTDEQIALLAAQSGQLDLC